MSLTGHKCNRPLGMKSGRIKNIGISASSEWDKYHAAHLARLFARRMGRYMGVWAARYNNYYQWLQIDLFRVSKVIKIATQGRSGVSQWVTKYYLLSSIDGIHYSYYKYNSNNKVSYCYCQCSSYRIVLVITLLLTTTILMVVKRKFQQRERSDKSSIC